MTPRNPFLISSPIPGSGEVHICLLPPADPTFGTLTYTYPLKLVPSAPHILDDSALQATAARINAGNVNPLAVVPRTVPLLFVLSYGGGLLPPDAVNLSVRLDPNTRLTMTTQGSTKIFPSSPFQQPRTSDSAPDPARPPKKQTIPSTFLPTATQTLTVQLAAHSALCLTPDPTQPYQGSKYHQRQIFTIHPTASLLLLDWTTEGRRARGESWDADLWRGCNEIWREMPGTSHQARPEKRLQLRDHVILEGEEEGPLGSRNVSGSGHGMLALREQGMGCFGTLVAVGNLVEGLGEFFMQEFEALPRIGGRDWGDEVALLDRDETESDSAARRIRETWRKDRLRLEKEEGVLWTAARVRGLVLVKFAANDFHGAKQWLGEMLNVEGTISREFGAGGLMCVR